MKKIIITLFIVLMACVPVYAKSLKFVQVTDTHLSIDGSGNGSRDVSKSVQNLKNTVNTINKMTDISFVVFSGDNIDSADEESLHEFGKITQALNVPYYLILGNHDSYNMGGITKEDYFNIVKQYNKNQKNVRSYYYITPDSESVVILLDGATEYIPSSHGYYPEEELAWLDNVLAKFKNKNAIIIQHFPYVEPVENKSHRIVDPELYFEVINKHKNIFAIFSGHYHCEKITQQDGIYHVSSPALISDPASFRVVEINYDKKPYELNTQIVPAVGQ